MTKRMTKPGSNVMVICRACGEKVVPIQTSRLVMRHQDVWVRGFTLSVPDTKCPTVRCGERGI